MPKKGKTYKAMVYMNVVTYSVLTCIRSYNWVCMQIMNTELGAEINTSIGSFSFQVSGLKTVLFEEKSIMTITTYSFS